jgi:hypothetical protein
LVIVGLMLAVMPAVAKSTELTGEPFGGADGNVLTSSSVVPFSGLDFALPAGGISAEELTNLGLDYTILAGNCGGGSPRYQLDVEGDGNVFVYIGDAPNFDNCGTVGTPKITGNLLESSDLRCDYTQLGGPFYGDCGNLADVLDGRAITGIKLVVDGGWKIDPQTFEVDPHVRIDLGNPSSKQECKKGGYTFFGYSNQGRCIKDVNHAGHHR